MENIDSNQVEKATRALIKYKSLEKNHDLIEENSLIWLIVTTKKIQDKHRLKPIRIPIRNKLGEPSVCCITKDPQREFKDLFEKNGIQVKVIGVDKLRKKYKTFEQKRQLCASYDLFIADERVLPLLPKLLGKVFFTKKKQPCPIDLTKTDLNKEFNSVINSTHLFHAKGVCHAIKVGHVGLDVVENAENIIDAIQGVADKLPGKWDNIQSINLKTSDSVALPIFNSLPNSE